MDCPSIDFSPIPAEPRHGCELDLWLHKGGWHDPLANTGKSGRPIVCIRDQWPIPSGKARETSQNDPAGGQTNGATPDSAQPLSSIHPNGFALFWLRVATSDQPKSVSHLRGQVVHRSVSISIDKPFPHPPVFKLLYQSVKKPIPAQMSFNLTRAGVVWGAVYQSENEAGSKKEKIISANIWESPTISVLLPFLVSLLTSLDKTVYVHIFTNNSWFKHVINVVNISFFDSDKQKKHP
jgi:hypothetical protein